MYTCSNSYGTSLIVQCKITHIDITMLILIIQVRKLCVLDSFISVIISSTYIGVPYVGPPTMSMDMCCDTTKRNQTS